MTCSDYAPLISRLLDGELPLGQQEEVREHISHCGDCSSLNAEWETQGTALRNFLADNSLGEDFIRKIRAENDKYLAKARPDTQRGWLRSDLFTYLQAAAAVLAAVLLLFRLFPGDGEKTFAQVINPGDRLEIRTSSSMEWKTAAPGVVLNPGDWLRNGELSAAQILVRDVSRITLQQGTVAQLANGVRERHEQVVLERGTIQSDGTSGSVDFEINTPVGKINAAASRFEVRVDFISVPKLEISENNAESLSVSIYPLAAVSVDGGKVQLVTEPARREVTAGNLAYITPTQFASIPGSGISTPVRSTLQSISHSTSGRGSLASSIALVDSYLQVQVQAKEIPLNRLLEWIAESRIQGGDDVRVSGSLAYPLNAAPADIITAVSEDLKIPMSVDHQEVLLKTVALEDKRRSLDVRPGSQFTIHSSPEGKLSFSLYNVPAAQAFRALRSAKVDLPTLASGSESLPITLSVTDMDPEQVYSQLQSALGLVPSEARQRIRVVKVGRAASARAAMVSGSASKDSLYPASMAAERDISPNTKVITPAADSPLKSRIGLDSLAGTQKSTDLTSPAAMGGNEDSNSLVNWNAAAQPGYVTGGSFPRGGNAMPSSGVTANAGLRAGGGADDPDNWKASTHLVWPAVFDTLAESIYSVSNLSTRTVRTLWMGFSSNGYLVGQFEFLLRPQESADVNPPRDFRIQLSSGGHWEVYSDSPLFIARNPAAQGPGTLEPLDADSLFKNWEFEASLLEASIPQQSMWMVNPGEKMVRIVVALLVHDRAVASQQYFLAPHAGMHWSLADLRSANPHFSCFPTGSVILTSAMDGAVAVGIVPGTRPASSDPGGEWVH